MAMITCICGHLYSSLRHKNKCPKCGADPKGEAEKKNIEQNNTIPSIFTSLKNQSKISNPQTDTTSNPQTDTTSNPQTDTARKPCPHCSEMVMKTANICPFCKQAIFSFDPGENATKTIVFGAIAFVFLSFGITYCAMWETENIYMPWAEKETERLMREAEKDVNRLMRKYQNNY